MRTKAGARTRFTFGVIAVFLFSLAYSACALPGGVKNATHTRAAVTVAASTRETAAGAVGARLDIILARGEIAVAMSPDFAPMEFIDNRKQGPDQYVGIDPWFAKYIADELGVELKIVPVKFDELHDSLKAGKADLAMSGLARTESRAELYELSDYYNNVEDGGHGALVLKCERDRFKTAGSFTGKAVAVQESSYQHELLSEQLPGAIPAFVSDISEGVEKLLVNEVDAIGVDVASGLGICENYPDLAMAEFRFACDAQGNVIGMPKGETALAGRINEIIAKAAAEDRFSGWIEEAEALAAEIGWQN